jgi:drug/metabolite transporter (DMT)-like permease
MSGQRVTRDYGRGVGLVLAGTVFVSFETLLLRLLHLDIWTVIWWRGALLGITCAVAAVATGASLRQLRQLGVAGLIAIVAFAVSVFSFISAINGTTVANTLVIASAAPLFAALLSWIFLRERVLPATWMAVAVLLLGIAVIFSGSVRTSLIAGDLCALLYAGCLAAYYVALRRCAPGHLLLVVAAGGLLSGLLAWPLAAPTAVAPHNIWLLLALGVIVVPASTILLSFGTRYLPAPDVTLIMMLEVLLGPLWVWLALEEIPRPATVAGGSLILLTVVGHSYLASGRSGKSGIRTQPITR